MRPICTFLVAVAFCAVPVVASEPGQPIDCTDWVFLEPGLSCVDSTPPGCEFHRACSRGPSLSVSVDGDLLWMEYEYYGGPCNTNGEPCLTLHAFRPPSGPTRIVAFVASRRAPSGDMDGVQGRWLPWGTIEDYIQNFDPSNGILYIPLESNTATTHRVWLAGITGFTTTAELVQSYVVQPSSLAFRVPYMPEGMGGADHFDTYWGALTHPIDFTQAQGLQCGYPASAPKLGDYLTVADPLPTPAPGTGYYYVTSATYQGQTRYGRKTAAGRQSGRAPGLLPSCFVGLEP